jgi:hypothetical protein
MKVGIVVYHKDASKYPLSWLHQCRDSLTDNVINCSKLQLPVNFEYYELNYGEGGRAFGFSRHNYRHSPLKNYAAAMNYIYKWAFEECDVVANVNVDDYYREDRFNKLLALLETGADIASSNYCLVDDVGDEIRRTDFAGLDIAAELARGNNIISNPCHMMKKRVFDRLKFNPELVPKEDLEYWRQCLSAGFTIKIAPEHLHYYRIHPNQSGNLC